ncbi:hypothetical protein BC832DRAFT_562214 [Gaertneriomyces semiglobifer]|nr:hypothetical protein BC832DRAFT_562214 [Gaertneriomyces semiglobifer]
MVADVDEGNPPLSAHAESGTHDLTLSVVVDDAAVVPVKEETTNEAEPTTTKDEIQSPIRRMSTSGMSGMTAAQSSLDIQQVVRDEVGPPDKPDQVDDNTAPAIDIDLGSATDMASDIDLAATTTTSKHRVPSRSPSVEEQLDQLMSEAAKDMGVEDLQDIVATRDKQVSHLATEIEQLKKVHSEMVAKIESQGQQIRELETSNRALRAVNRSLLEDAESFHSLRQYIEKRSSVSDLKSSPTGPTPETTLSIPNPSSPSVNDAKDRSSLDATSTTASNDIDSATQRPTMDPAPPLTDSDRAKYECTIKALREEIRALNLYANKIASRILIDDHLERALLQSYQTDNPSRPKPGAKNGSLRLQIPQSIKKRSSTPILSLFSRGPQTAPVEPSTRPFILDPSNPQSPGWLSKLNPWSAGVGSPRDGSHETLHVSPAASPSASPKRTSKVGTEIVMIDMDDAATPQPSPRSEERIQQRLKEAVAKAAAGSSQRSSASQPLVMEEVLLV